METLGIFLGEERRRRGLSLRQAAELTGLSHETVRAAENGTAALGAVAKLVHAFGISEDKAANLLVRDLVRLFRPPRAEMILAEG